MVVQVLAHIWLTNPYMVIRMLTRTLASYLLLLIAVACLSLCVSGIRSFLEFRRTREFQKSEEFRRTRGVLGEASPPVSSADFKCVVIPLMQLCRSMRDRFYAVNGNGVHLGTEVVAG